MAGQTKMIIITSNEDLIRQFSLNKAINTHVIDIVNDKNMTLTVNDNDNNNNMTDLAFFAGLSELNSSSDQVFKRVLDSPHHNRSKAAKVSKKSNNLICSICGDHAIGFNYDVLSCASCKAFFRRNANQSPEKIKCLTSHRGQCSVAYGTRRKCPRCRLDRCFAAGMRKDFILSDEQKQRRKQRLEENRNFTSKRLSTSESTSSLSISNPLPKSESLSPVLDDIDHLLMDMDRDNGNNILYENGDSNEMEETLIERLFVEDWITIEGVRSSFVSIFPMEQLSCPFGDALDRASALLSWSQFANQLPLRFISFFRHIDEFEDLRDDDRFVLIKYNLLPLFPIFKCFNYKLTNDCCSTGDNEEAQKNRRFFILCDQSLDIRDKFVNLVHSLVEVTEQDPIILSLLVTILIFSQGLSMNEDEPSLKDPSAVNRAQVHYTKLLWIYLISKWDEEEASRRFTHIFFIIIRIQSAAKTTREFFRVQFMKTDIVDRIAPLMQSVLHIC